MALDRAVYREALALEIVGARGNFFFIKIRRSIEKQMRFVKRYGRQAFVKFHVLACINVAVIRVHKVAIMVIFLCINLIVMCSSVLTSLLTSFFFYFVMSRSRRDGKDVHHVHGIFVSAHFIKMASSIKASFAYAQST